MKTLTVVKVGGKILSDPEKLEVFLLQFSRIQGSKILVHGGGNKATQLADQLGVQTQMINGRRITSKEMVDVIAMTYAGLINKKVVTSLQKLHVNALGLSGADGNIILCKKRPVGKIDYGFAGDIESINASTLQVFLGGGLVPVICPLTHDGNGQLLNTNADTIAESISSAFSEQFSVRLIYAFEYGGVMRDIDDPSSVIERVDTSSLETMKADKIISEGMIPKIYNAMKAKDSGVQEVYISGYNIIDQPQKGTQIWI